MKPACLLILALILALAPAAPGAPAAVGSTAENGVKKAKTPSPALKELAASLTQAQALKLMNIINRGSAVSVTLLPEIGPTRAEAIIAGRPYENPLALLQVSGIGEATLTAVLNFARADFHPTLKPKARRK